MAHAITFDTFQCAKELKKAGFTETQVEAQVGIIKTQVEFVKEQTDAINDLIDNNLATKQDINEVKAEIAQMGYKVTMRLGGMIVVAVTVLGFLIQLHH